MVYLRDSHYSINSLPISFVIQLTHCRSAASLTAYVSSACPSLHLVDLLHYFFKLWELLEALMASVCAVVVNSQFSVPCFDIVAIGSFHWTQTSPVAIEILMALIQLFVTIWRWLPLRVKTFLLLYLAIRQLLQMGNLIICIHQTPLSKAVILPCRSRDLLVFGVLTY